jgi:hypothetical protein
VQSGRATEENQKAKGKSEKPYVQKSLLKKQEITVLQCRLGLQLCGPLRNWQGGAYRCLSPVPRDSSPSLADFGISSDELW